MANAGAIRAGRAFVELFTDDSKLVQGLKGASSKLQAWGNAMVTLAKVAFAGTAAAAFGAAMTFAKAGDALDKMSTRTGTSVEFLSALGHAANLGGSDLKGMETAIKKLQRAGYDAATGSKAPADAFAALGVNVRGAGGKLKSTEQLFMEVADALAKVDGDTEKAALAMEIFGREGTAMLPMLKDGKDGLVGMMNEAKRLGLVMSTDTAAGAAEFTDRMAEMWAAIQMATVDVGAIVAPVFRELALTIRDTARLFGSLFNAFREAGEGAELFGEKARIALKTGDDQRVNAKVLFGELGNLASAHSLNNEQMDRAQSIIDALALAYGDLGVSVDRVQGKIVGFSEAQAKASKLMREAAILETRKRLGEVQREIQALNKPSPTWGEKAAMALGLPGSVERVKERFAADQIKAAGLIKEQEALLLRIRALQAGEAGAVTGGAKGPIPGEATPEAVRDAMSYMHQYQTIRANMIEDSYKREIALINEKWNYDIAQARLAGKEIANLEELHQLDLTAAAEKHSREQHEARLKLDEERAAGNAQLNEEIERLQIEGTKKGLDKELALLQAKHRRERELAVVEGLDIGAVARKQALEIQVAKLGMGADRSRFEGIGTFSAVVAGRLAAGDSAARIVSATEQTAANTKRMEGRLEALTPDVFK